MLGFAAANLVCWLLQRPIALTASTTIQMTVMARVCLRLINPIPGFGLMQHGIFNHHPIAPGTPPDWTFTRAWGSASSVTNQDYFKDDKPMNWSTCPWVLSHHGDAQLAGGYYLDFWNHTGPAPIGGSNSTLFNNGYNPSITIKGKVQYGCVYICDTMFPLWTTNRGRRATPRYFAVIRRPFFGQVLMVGFESLEHASNQASNRAALVPPDAELCITYNTVPLWEEFHPATENNEMKLLFWRVFTGPSDAVGDVYSTTNNLTYSARTQPVATQPVGNSPYARGITPAGVPTPFPDLSLAWTQSPPTSAQAGQYTTPLNIPAWMPMQMQQQQTGPWMTSTQPSQQFLTTSNPWGSDFDEEEEEDGEEQEEQEQELEVTSAQGDTPLQPSAPTAEQLQQPDHISLTDSELNQQMQVLTMQLEEFSAEWRRREERARRSRLPTWLDLLRKAVHSKSQSHDDLD